MPPVKYGRLTVIESAGKLGCDAAVLCRCDCGQFATVRLADLKRGKTRSCGCLYRESNRQRTANRKTGTRLYRIWQAMKTRTTNPKAQHFSVYGGRGIRVCDEWFHSFPTFESWALANGYQEGLSIDRIDPNGHYCPENCRWITMAEQQRNKRNVPLITFNGETHTRPEWAELLGIPKATLASRLRYGWSIEKALTTPQRRVT